MDARTVKNRMIFLRFLSPPIFLRFLSPINDHLNRFSSLQWHYVPVIFLIFDRIDQILVVNRAESFNSSKGIRKSLIDMD